MDRLLSFPLPIVLRQELGQLTVHYYEENSKHLTREIIWHLQPYVPSQILSALEKQIPPPEPTSLPPEEIHVLKWFQTEYLPYRQWQSRNNDEHAAELVCSHARTFTYWYLRAYPRWLLESTWISFQQAALLKESSPHAIIFCAVVDGLPAWDAEDLAQAISGKIERLQLQQKSYCFAPLPTVTQFAKESLLKGVPPRLTSETPFLGKILPDNISPLQKLKNAKPGELYFWRLNQPDAAYHLESESKRNRQVRAELEVILQAIKDVVEGLPQHIPFTVIVTTDHGRLLNPKSPRRLPTPNGMQAHGRVAWGSIDQSFDEYGFKVDEEAGWIAIHGERFEMTHDMLIALNEDSFQNKKSGSEPFPHGGLFPEEAIVPWFVFERDATPPILEVDVNGAGEAAISGSITVTIKNASRLAITCLSTSLSHGGQASGHWDIAPLGTTEFKTQITPWPSKGDLAGIKASLLFRQPNGKTFTIEVSPRLNVISLYEQDDSILKELDL